MRVAFLGDTHANIAFVEQFYDYIDVFDVDAIIQVGDFGYGFHERQPEIKPPSEFVFLNEVDRIANQYGTPLYWIDGNHENFSSLYDDYVQGRWDEFIPIRDNVTYIPRGKAWEWDGCKFMAFGGAHSVNKDRLVKYVSWWPQEMPTFEEVDRAVAHGPVDVLVTHDVPNISDIRERMSMDLVPGCMECRSRLDIVAASARPRKIIHGHYHFPMRARFETEWGECRIVGLDADYTALHMGDVFDIVDTIDYAGA